MVEQDLVEIRIRADERKLRCFPVEDDLVCVRTKLYPAPEEFFEFRRPARASATASRSWSDRPGLSSYATQQPHRKMGGRPTHEGLSAPVPAMRRGAAVAASVASGAAASVALAAPWGNPFRVMAPRRRRESWPSYIPGRPAVSQ